MIRRVWPDGTITTVAGTGVAGYTGDGGRATGAELDNPHTVWATPDGSSLIADAANSAIREVDPNGTITTVAGNGTPGFTGDGGPATSAELSGAKAIAQLSSGAILIGDTANNVIRYVGAPVVPAALAPPTVSGQAVVGKTLTASTGGWSAAPPPSYMYQWQSCDASGNGCADIVFATSATYTVALSDLGDTLRVVVTAGNPGGSAFAPSAVSTVVSATASPPSNTSPPTISGTLVDGQMLTADPGTWSGTIPMTFSYQWQRCDSSGAGCANIAGATAQAYMLTSADVGSTLRVVVSAMNAASSSAYASAVLADSPRSYWRFDGTGSNLSDLQGYANGTYVGSPTLGVPGLVVGDADTAASFNGSAAYADVGADPVWTSTPFSIEIVVQPSVLPVNRRSGRTFQPGFAAGG